MAPITSTIHAYISNGEVLAGLGVALRYAAIAGRMIDRIDNHLRNVEQILRDLHATVRAVSRKQS